MRGDSLEKARLKGLNNMQGRIFLVSSTLHSSTELYLGDPVCRWTQEQSALKTPGAVWRLDYMWTHQDFQQLVGNTSQRWQHHLWWVVLVVQGTIFDCIDLQRIRDKWEYILHDRPRSKEHQLKQRCPLWCSNREGKGHILWLHNGHMGTWLRTWF